MSDPIHQEVVFDTTPEQVYGVLTDATRFSALCGGAPTEIDARDGGAFSCFGGMIIGRNVECTPGERLVQAWRVASWQPGVYSMVRFELRAEGKGTRVVLDHSGFPAGQAPHLGQGWHDNYWNPLRAMLAAADPD